MLRLLPHTSISKKLWDECNTNSYSNSILHSYDYISCICSHWMAVVYIEDGIYKLILPLPYKIKLGIKYVYHPPLLQQLNIVHRKNFICNHQKIWNLIKSKFLYVHCKVAASTNAPASWKLNKKDNFIIDLSCNYKDIYIHYHNTLKSILRKASHQYHFIWNKELTKTDFLQFTKLEKYNNKMAPIQDELHKVLDYTWNKEGICYSLYLDDEFLACIYIVKSATILTNLINLSTEKGKKYNAVSLLIDYVLRKYAGQHLIFDFEGSSVPSIAKFFAKFGGAKIQYDEIQYTKWYMRIFI